jgi:hypothetical protein
MELLNSLTKLPDQKLNEVEKFVKRILAQLKVEGLTPVSLKGVWRDKGFEKISDLETELEKIRADLGNTILQKEF